MSQFKVGDITYSKSHGKSNLYCIFRIQSDSLIGVLLGSSPSWVYFGEYETLLTKARSTKKRKAMFLRAFANTLLGSTNLSGTSHKFNNLDYIEVIAALTHG